MIRSTRWQRFAWVPAVAMILAAAITRAPRAAEQGTAAVADSVLAAATADSLTGVPHYVFKPRYTNTITGDVSKIGMRNAFSTSITAPWGPVFNFALSSDQSTDRNRQRPQHNETKNMTGSVLYLFNPAMIASVSYLDNRVFNRSTAVGGGFTDVIVNDKSVTSLLTYKKSLDGLGLDWSATGNVATGDRAFKTDQTAGGAFFGGASYYLLDRHLKVQGRGGAHEALGRSNTPVGTFNGQDAGEDSLLASAAATLSDSIQVSFNYSNYHAVRHYIDLAQTSFGVQKLDPSSIIPETQTSYARTTTVALTSRLFDNHVKLTLSADHDDHASDYRVQQTRTSRNVGNEFQGDVSYDSPWGSTVAVHFEGSSTLNDLGPQSVSSLTDKRKMARASISHTFSKTLSIILSGTTQLAQSFYVDYAENPRDRDQVDSSANLSITSTRFTSWQPTISVTYSASQYINIDSTQSEGNLRRYHYELKPGYTYVARDWLTIVQSYGVAIEYTDYIYKATENFLDRNLSFSNEFRFQPTGRVGFNMLYTYLFHDTGSYLPDPLQGGLRVLSVDRKDRTDGMRLRVTYKLNDHINVFTENYYSRQANITAGSDEQTVTETGSIRAGASGDYDWGNGRKLTFSLARVKKFSPYGGDVEKNYWDARSEFDYPF